jgi:hypothetical protein
MVVRTETTLPTTAQVQRVSLPALSLKLGFQVDGRAKVFPARVKYSKRLRSNGLEDYDVAPNCTSLQYFPCGF